jgi:hypothetical protein
MELSKNKDRTLRSEEIEAAELRPYHHFWHNVYNRCIVYSVEQTEGGHCSVRFKAVSEGRDGVLHEAVYPKDSTFTKVWNIKMNNEVRYGAKRFRR